MKRKDEGDKVSIPGALSHNFNDHSRLPTHWERSRIFNTYE